MSTIKFGWHMPSFAVDDSSGGTLVRQMANVLAKIQDSFDTAWVEHFIIYCVDFPSPAGIELFAQAVIPQLSN